MAGKQFIFWIILGVLAIGVSQNACTSDTFDPPFLEVCDTLQVTYTIEVKPIIDATCAYAGCHGTGSSDGDFSEYLLMLPFLESGSVRNRIIEVGDMPPNNVPSDKELSPENLEIIQCWLKNGFPEM